MTYYATGKPRRDKKMHYARALNVYKLIDIDCIVFAFHNTYNIMSHPYGNVIITLVIILLFLGS